MSEALLNVEKREDLTTHVTRQMRRSGRVPAIYYMHGEDPVAVSVDEKEFRGVVHSGHSIIDLVFGPKKKVKSVIREVQWHPVTSAPMHVDFMGVKMTEEVTVEMSITLVGTPVGVKNEGGILQQQLREIAISCLPTDIPDNFEIDVADLAIGDTIRVSDLSFDKVKILTEAEQSIVTVRAPKVVVEETPAEVEGEEAEGAPEEGEGEGETETE